MNIKSIPLGLLGTNCYIVYDQDNCLIVDPGGDHEKVIDFVKTLQVTPQAILLTHAHFDHIGAVDALRSFYIIDVYLHEAEKDWLTNSRLNGSLLFTGRPLELEAPDKYLKPGEMTLSSFNFNVLHTPGHSPGSVTFEFKDAGFIISGDVLFKQGVGRTDLIGGDADTLVDSIKNKLYRLDDKVTVYPGHGPQTSIQDEKNENPYISI